jgi:ABC-2 type transport system permease protein
VIRASFAKNWRLSVTAPSWTVNRLVGPIVTIAVAAYSYLALASPASIGDRFRAYGASADFAGFLILGQTVLSVFWTMNWRGGMAIQRERWMGTLEIVLLAPTSRVAFVLGETLYALADSGWMLLVSVLVTAAWFGAGFRVADPPLALAAVVATVAAMVALSLFFSGFYVLTRSAGPLSNAIAAPMQFFSGARFPVSALPSVLQAVSYALPLTYGMVAVRTSFLGGPQGDVVESVLVLVASTIVLWAAGVALLRAMERRAKLAGTLHRY